MLVKRGIGQDGLAVGPPVEESGASFFDHSDPHHVSTQISRIGGKNKNNGFDDGRRRKSNSESK